MLFQLPVVLLFFLSIPTFASQSFNFDFGESSVFPGYIKIERGTIYTSEVGYGWDEPVGSWNPGWGEWGPDALREDYLFSSQKRTFRVDLPNGAYRIALIMTHSRGKRGPVTIMSGGKILLSKHILDEADYEPLIFTVEVKNESLEIDFISHGKMWVVNGLSIEPVKRNEKNCFKEEILMGDWDITGKSNRNNRFIPKSKCLAGLVVLGHNWNNYEVHARMHIRNGFNNAALIFRYQNPNTYYALSFQIAENERNPLPPPGGSSYIKLIKREGDKVTVLSNLPKVEPKINQTYELKVECVESLIKCYLDGQLLFEAIDASLRDGRLGLRSLGDRCDFSEVEQREISDVPAYFQSDMNRRIEENRKMALDLSAYRRESNGGLADRIQEYLKTFNRKIEEFDRLQIDSFKTWAEAKQRMEAGLEESVGITEYLRGVKKSGGVLNEEYILGTEYSCQKVFRPIKYFHGNISNNATVALCRNEYEAFQMVLIPLKDLYNVDIEITDLFNEAGDRIGKENIEWNPVYYVPNPPERDFQIPGGWPDALLETGSFNVKIGELQPVWITVYAPEGTPPGNYKGKIIVKPADAGVKSLRLEVRVWDFSLPARPFLKTAFGFWERDLSKYHAVEPGSPEFRELADRYRENMLNHRISFRSIQSRPRYILTEKGRIRMDFSEFDREVEKYLSSGLTCFTVGLGFGAASMVGAPQYLKISVYDEAKGQDAELQFGPAFSERFQQVIKDVYQTWEQHLKDKGWAQFAYNYIADEPPWPNPFVEKLLNTVHGFAPEIKTAVPMTDFPQDMNEIKNLDIWIYHAHVHHRNSAMPAERTEKKMWWYVSWDYFLTTQELIEHRRFFWDMWRDNITGLLYWAVNSWTANPWENLHRYPPSHSARQRLDFGNALLVYPGKKGPVNTIRWEIIRDGVEDYDYFVLLRDKTQKLKDKGDNAHLVRESEKLLLRVKDKNTSVKNPQKMYEIRKKIAQQIERMNSARHNPICATLTIRL